MPAIIAHHLFGSEVYSELQSVIGASDRARDAFLLGNLGPDPLLCLRVLPSAVPFRDIGSVMHAERPAELLSAVHGQCASSEEGAVRAWALGFLCHYLLDSTAHPLVYAQQEALCAAEDGAAASGAGNGAVPGIDGGTRQGAGGGAAAPKVDIDATPRIASSTMSRAGSGTLPGIDGGTIHAAIETEFDEHVLRRKLGIDVSEFSPHRETLGCPADALGAISVELSDVVSSAYGRALPPRAYAAGVRLYRAAQRAVDSKREGLRRRVDYARLAGRRYPHVLALTHSTRERGGATFTNHDHVPWPHPFEPGAIVSESFDELYDAALDRAAASIPMFARPDFSFAACEDLTCGLNFRGERVG